MPSFPFTLNELKIPCYRDHRNVCTFGAWLAGRWVMYRVPPEAEIRLQRTSFLNFGLMLDHKVISSMSNVMYLMLSIKMTSLPP